RGAGERRAALAARDDREAAASDRLGEAADAVDAPELAVEGGDVLAPQASHQRDVLAGAVGAARERDAEGGELLAQPADANAEHEAAVGQAIEAGDLLREDERVVLRNEADAGAETDPAGDGGGRAQGHEGVEPVGR